MAKESIGRFPLVVYVRRYTRTHKLSSKHLESRLEYVIERAVPRFVLRPFRRFMSDASLRAWGNSLEDTQPMQALKRH